MFYVYIDDLGSELFSEVQLYRTYQLPELTKSGFKALTLGAITTSSGKEFQGFTTLTSKLFLLVSNHKPNANHTCGSVYELWCKNRRANFWGNVEY